MRNLNFAIAGVTFMALLVVDKSVRVTPLVILGSFCLCSICVFNSSHDFRINVSMIQSRRKFSLQQDGIYAIVGRRLSQTVFGDNRDLTIVRRNVKEITVLLLDQMFSSTAIGPMEVFRHAGSLWNILTGSTLAPNFHVITASADGLPVNCDGEIQIRPNVALKDVGKTDLIFVPTTGLSVDDVVERNAAIVPWLKRRSAKDVAIASVCSGVGLVAAAGLLDGKRATPHWGLAGLVL